jgi:hypothetical protein
VPWLYNSVTMSHRFQLSLGQTQYQFLSAEAERSSVSVAELIRRAIDATYGPSGTKNVYLITHTLGRRPGVPLAD